MKNETAVNPWSLYSLEDLFYELEAAEDEGKEAKAEKIRKAIRQTSAGAYLALDPASVKKLLMSVRKEVGNIWESNQRPVLLTSMDVRRYTRKLIEQEMYDLPVLSHQELTEEITIQPLGRISM
jgi:type III secretion protein V